MTMGYRGCSVSLKQRLILCLAYSFGKESVTQEVLILEIISVKASAFDWASVLMRNGVGFLG